MLATVKQGAILDGVSALKQIRIVQYCVIKDQGFMCQFNKYIGVDRSDGECSSHDVFFLRSVISVVYSLIDCLYIKFPFLNIQESFLYYPKKERANVCARIRAWTRAI